jgi:hypothetical protein
LYWLPTLVFLAHIAEEFPRFPAWATRHFGATSRAWYVYTHIALVAIAVTISARAEAAAPRTIWPLLAMAFQWVLATNALFHIATTIMFKEYSPGVVTGTLLFLPATAYLFNRVVAAHFFTTVQLASVVAIGTVLGAAVVASLWLPMDLDWRLRRPEHVPRQRPS